MSWKSFATMVTIVVLLVLVVLACFGFKPARTWVTAKWDALRGKFAKKDAPVA